MIVKAMRRNFIPEISPLVKSISGRQDLQLLSFGQGLQFISRSEDSRHSLRAAIEVRGERIDLAVQLAHR